MVKSKFLIALFAYQGKYGIFMSSDTITHLFSLNMEYENNTDAGQLSNTVSNENKPLIFGNE